MCSMTLSTQVSAKLGVGRPPFTSPSVEVLRAPAYWEGAVNLGEAEALCHCATEAEEANLTSIEYVGST